MRGDLSDEPDHGDERPRELTCSFSEGNAVLGALPACLADDRGELSDADKGRSMRGPYGDGCDATSAHEPDLVGQSDVGDAAQDGSKNAADDRIAKGLS